MSIQSEINRITSNISSAYTAAAEKNATMPIRQSSENLATTILSIPTGVDLPELPNPATETEVFAGKEYIDGTGDKKIGAFTIDAEITEQDSLLAQIRTALVGKTAGGGSEVPMQEKTVSITENGTHEIFPDVGYILSKVGVSVNVPIPDGYIKPSGTLAIEQNGEHNVTAYENVSVAVPVPDGYIQPSGELEITENGTHDVTQYASVNINVAGSSEPDPREPYQRVEYIESATEGTYPYIITDFYADNESGLEVIASFPTLVDRIPMGSRENSDATRFYCVYPLSANSIYYGFNTGTTISCKLVANTIYRLQTNFLNSRLVNVYTADGTRKGGGSISGTLNPPHTVPVSIFGYHSAASAVVTSKREYKLYGARCSKGHEVVREYIPCYRKSDGVVGLYEKITGQFLTAETGAFAKGVDIDW